MCSIGGFICSTVLPGDSALRLARGLLYYGRQRGGQSAGLFANGKLFKKACSPADFIYEDTLKEIMKGGSQVLLTHTRMPTSGGTGDEQAHPFWSGQTISVHNGGIYNCAELKQQYNLNKTSGVDSELITEAIEQLGIENISDFISNVRGSAAIAVLHHGELYLARDGNPLEYQLLTVNINGKQEELLVFGSTQSQVKDAIAHCWLIDGLPVTTTLPTGKVFKVSPAGLLTEVCRFSTATYSYVSNGGGGHPFQGRGNNGMFMGGGGSSDYGRERFRTTSNRQPQSYGMPLMTMKDGVRTWIIRNYELSDADVLDILRDPEVLPPGNAAGRGFKEVGQADGRFHMYDAEYAMMQVVKYELGAQYFRIGGGTDTGKSKKKKKDRNRNRPAGSDKAPLLLN